MHILTTLNNILWNTSIATWKILWRGKRTIQPKSMGKSSWTNRKRSKSIHYSRRRMSPFLWEALWYGVVSRFRCIYLKYVIKTRNWKDASLISCRIENESNKSIMIFYFRSFYFCIKMQTRVSRATQSNWRWSYWEHVSIHVLLYDVCLLQR